MSDLIERQAAIDAIERNAYRHTYLDQIVDIIKGLPSVQPDKNMIHLQKEQAYMQGWDDGREALRKGILDER